MHATINYLNRVFIKTFVQYVRKGGGGGGGGGGDEWGIFI